MGMTRIGLLLVVCFAGTATSAPTPDEQLSHPDSVSEIVAGTTSQLVKTAEGCEYLLEEGINFKKITDRAGRTYTLLFDENDRLTEFKAPGGKGGAIVYEQNTGRALGIVDMHTGVAMALPKAPPGFLSTLRAQGRLPTLSKIIGKVCAQRVQKVDDGEDWSVLPEEMQDQMYEDYWVDVGLGDLDAIFALKPPPDPYNCQLQVECKDDCVDWNIFNLLGCVAVTGTWAALGYPGGAAIVGTVCAVGAQVVLYPECRRRCEVRYTC